MNLSDISGVAATGLKNADLSPPLFIPCTSPLFPTTEGFFLRADRTDAWTLPGDILKRAVSRWALHLNGPFAWGCQNEGDWLGVIFRDLPVLHGVSTGRADVDDVLYLIMVKWAEMMAVTHARALSNTSVLINSSVTAVRTGRTEGSGVYVRRGSSIIGSDMLSRELGAVAGEVPVPVAASESDAEDRGRKEAVHVGDTTSFSTSTSTSTSRSPYTSSYLEQFMATAYGASGDSLYSNSRVC